MFERDYYKIGEVAEILDCSIEDILDAGFNHHVRIWVWANSWSEGVLKPTEEGVLEEPGRLINGPRQLTPHEIHQVRFGYQLEDGIGVYVSDEGNIKLTKVEVNHADKIRADNLILLKEEVERLKKKLRPNEQHNLSDSELSEQEISTCPETIPTATRHASWGETVKDMQNEAENHIKKDDLSEMALRAAKKILENYQPDSPNRDSFYDRYFDNNSQYDADKLADTIRTTLTRSGEFKRRK